MKKRLSLLLILGLLLPVLLTTSCQTAEQTSDKTVALKFVRIGNDAAEADYWKRLIGDFNQANPGIKVEYDDAAIGEPMETKLNSMFSAGLGPDIIGHGILSVAARVEAGHYQPITTYFNSWEGKDDLMAAVLANGTYKNEIYGLAYSTTPFIFAWRKDLFSDAGLDPEKAPQNWEELESFSRQSPRRTPPPRSPSPVSPFPRSRATLSFDTLVFGNGGPLLNDQGEPTPTGQVETLSSWPDRNDVGIPFQQQRNQSFIAGTRLNLINNVALTPMLKNEAYAASRIALPPATKRRRRSAAATALCRATAAAAGVPNSLLRLTKRKC